MKVKWSTWRLGVFTPWRSPFTSAIEHESGWAVGLILTLHRRRQLVFNGSNYDISVSQSSHNPGLLSRLPVCDGALFKQQWPEPHFLHNFFFRWKVKNGKAYTGYLTIQEGGRRSQEKGRFWVDRWSKVKFQVLCQDLNPGCLFCCAVTTPPIVLRLEVPSSLTHSVLVRS